MATLDIGRYLAVQAHPPAVQGVLTEPGWPTEVVLPRGGVDHFQALVPYSPVHTEVGGFSWLASFSITYSCEKQKFCFAQLLVDFQLNEFWPPAGPSVDWEPVHLQHNCSKCDSWVEAIRGPL